MTTIAAKDGIMSCDSNISSGYQAAAKKIRKKNGIIVGFAGDWIAGEYFARYYLGNRSEKPDRDSDDDFELLILKPSGIYLADKRLREVRIRCKHYAIGSGSMAAMVAMNMGATAAEAVKEAAKVDDYTGGKIISLSLT